MEAVERERHDIRPDYSQPSQAATEKPSGWPQPLDSAALYGLAGDVVRTIEPHTEADPASLLLQFLAGLGNVVGRNPCFMVEATRHYLNLFVALVGDTSKARKGTSWGHVDRLFGLVEAQLSGQGQSKWKERIISGLSSGEGLIWVVRDPMRAADGSEDPGVIDKRRIVIDGEFSQTLKMLSRQGNTLSPVIRNAWDSGDLRITTKNSPAEATGAHISFIGHITRDELKRELTNTEMANGFANRYLWTAVRRSKLLPEGGNLASAALTDLVKRIQEVVGAAHNIAEMKRDEEARTLWCKVYPFLSEGGAGMLGAVTARAEAQVIRLACLYAILDLSASVQLQHLQAALAVWDYCLASAGLLFGNATGDSAADQIVDALRRAGSEGLSRTQIRDLFNRNETKQRIEAALRLLEERKLVERHIWGGDQRTEMWFAR